MRKYGPSAALSYDIEDTLKTMAVRDPDLLDDLFAASGSLYLQHIKDAPAEDLEDISFGCGEMTEAMQKVDIILTCMRTEPSVFLPAIARDTDRLREDSRWKKSRSTLLKAIGTTAKAIQAADDPDTWGKNIDATGIKLDSGMVLSQLGRRRRSQVDYTDFYESTAEQDLDLDTELWEDETISKVYGKAKRKLDAYACSVMAEPAEGMTAEIFISQVLSKCFANPIYEVIENGKSRKGLYGLCDKDREFRTPGFVFTLCAGFLKWRSLSPLGEEQKTHVAATAEKAVRSTLRAYMLAKILADLTADSGKNDSCIFGTPPSGKAGSRSDDINLLYRYVNRLDYAEVLASCMFMTAVELEKTERIRRDALYHGYMLRQQSQKARREQAAEETIRKLTEKTAALEAELDRLKEKDFSATRNENQIKRLNARIKDLNSRNLSLERELSMLRRKTAKKGPARTAAQAKAPGPAEKKQPRGMPGDTVPDINVTGKRYLFICDNEVESQKLEKVFTNSKFSTSYTITPTNLGTFEACVCIVPNVSHPTYNRVKKMCANTGTPFLNCNVKGTDKIREFLIGQEIEKIRKKEA